MNKVLAAEYVSAGPEKRDWTAQLHNVNLRALIILVAILVLIPAIFFVLSIVQDQRLQRIALAEAKGFIKANQVDLALLTLSHYLESWPEDIEALELAADLVSRDAKSMEDLINATQTQDQLLRLDPMGPGRQENRRLLVELYLRYGEALRMASTRQDLSMDKYVGRYRTAVKIAQQRIAFGSDDADSHRLLAMAYEGLSTTGDAKALADSTIEYERALRRDPGDVIAAERLALINLERRNDQAGADEILDELIKAKPSSSEARLARYRYFLKSNREELARSEIELATRLAPTELHVRLTAASESLRRRDTAGARRHLAAVGTDARTDKRVLLLRGQIELVEQHADVAIDEWRRSLILVGGSDKDLTWNLANTLIKLRRFAEARPLVAQYERLVGDSSNPMSHLLQGLLKEATKNPVAAIGELENAKLSIEGNLVGELELTLGRCYETLNDDEKALASYRKASEASLWSSTPRRSLARILKKTNPEKAAETLDEAIKAIPGDPLLYCDLARIRLEQQSTLPPDSRDWNQVDAVLTKAKKAGLDNLNFLQIKIDSLAARGQIQQAVGLLEEATKGPARQRVDFWIGLHSCLLKLGRASEAYQILEVASAPEAAGDHNEFRAARARLLVQGGQARAALEILKRNVESIPLAERPLLAKARVEIYQQLGDFRSAHEACLEWSKMAPDDPEPGFILLGLSQQSGNEDSAKLGLDILQAIGSQDEPFALAARAFDLLLSNRQREETRSARIDMADQLSQRLQAIAPRLPVTHLLRGIILERNHRIEEAITDYRTAIRGDSSGMALNRLVSLLTRQKRFNEIASLKKNPGDRLAVDQIAATASLEMGDKERAEKFYNEIVEGLPDDLQIRSIQVRLLRELGKTKEAEATLRELVERQPNLPGPWLSLLIFQNGQDNKDETKKTIEQARAAYHGDHPDLFLARCHWLVGNHAEAAKLFDLAVNTNPSDLETLKVASEFDDSTGRKVEAEARLRKAIQVAPSAAWASNRLALLLSKRPGLASWTEAWNLVSTGVMGSSLSPEVRLVRATLLERSPDPALRLESVPFLQALADDLPASSTVAVEARGRLARIYLDSKKPAEAARVIEVVANGPSVSNPSTLALFIEALARSGRIDEADRRLTRLAELEPKSVRTASCRSWIFLAQGKKAEAASTMELTFDESEKSPEAESVGIACFKQILALGQVDAAEQLARRIAARWPKNTGMLVRIQIFKGDFAAAFESCRLSIASEENPEVTQIMVDLANSPRVDAEIRKKAEALVDQIQAKASENSSIVSILGGLRHRQHRFEDEVQLYLKSLESNPSDEVLLNNLAWNLCQCLDRPQEALVKIDEAIRISGRTPSLSDTRGVILIRLNRLDEAIQDLEDAVKDQPSVTRYYHLARAYFHAGKSDEHHRFRDLAKKATITSDSLDPVDQADFAAVMAP